MLNIYSEISQKTKLKGKSIVDLANLSLSATSSENLARYTYMIERLAREKHTEFNFPKPEAYFHPEHLGIVYTSLLGLVLEGYTVEVSTYSSSFLNWVGEKIEYQEIASTEVSVQVECSDGSVNNLNYNSNGIIDSFPIGYFSPRG
jgi:hypothetical protein